jgi:deoxycytidylate deaminase
VIHAEVHAMLQVPEAAFLGGSVFILEVHEREEATFCDAHPCPNCNNALTRLGVRRAVFTRAEGGLGVWDISHKAAVEAPSYDKAKEEDSFVRPGKEDRDGFLKICGECNAE